jgi:DNA-binding beta-propeller fold protein YncE
MVAPGPYVGATPIVPSAVVLPFSANGIAFSRDGSALYIANMSTSIIYKQKVKHCGNPFTGCETNGGLSVFSRDPEHLIQGPDNMDFDDNGNLWVASGQNHHVIALDRQGDIVGVFGKFRGFDDQGAPKGLLQPSGIIFSRGKIYIGNESSQSLVRASENINWSALKLFTLSVVDPEVLDEGHPSDDHNDSYSHNYDDHSHNDRH